MSTVESRRWEDAIQDRIQIGVDVNLPVGRINLTYRSITDGWPFGGDVDKNLIGLYYGGSPIDGIELDVGGHYRPEDEEMPFKFGVGLYYNGDGWGVKTRTTGRIRQLNDEDKAAGKADPGLWLRADIMPWYAAEFAEIRCSVRIQLDGDNDIGWHVNPYIRKQIGPMQFNIGIMYEDDNGDGDATFKLPMSMIFGF